MSEVADQALLDLVNKPNAKLREQRIAANIELVRILSLMLTQFPDLRFSQALANFGFVKQTEETAFNYWTDEFYIEPKELLKRVSESVAKVYE